ncbi:MAG TPA: hypothetical protein VHC95_07565 [Opitutales bacterium]|nr:hypothetical protein [Opitutales bacterium]
MDDLVKAKAWYAQVLEVAPYFDQPYYVGFAVGGFELGLVPGGKQGPGGVVAFWGVANCADAVARLENLGAAVVEPLQDVGGGIKVATVADLFGNFFGVIENPHFDSKKVR